MFVTFEGGEGTGKTTLAHRMQDALKAEGRDVVFTREPGGTLFGEEARKLLLYSDKEMQIVPRAQLFVFLAARIQHIEQLIKPALARGAIVLCDRFSDSTIAYQGEGQKMGFEYVSSCTALATDGFEPTLTFFIDLDPKIGLLRAEKRRAEGMVDRMEQEALAFHERARCGFVALAEKFPKRIVRLDGQLDPDALFTQAYAAFSAIRRQ